MTENFVSQFCLRCSLPCGAMDGTPCDHALVDERPYGYAPTGVFPVVDRPTGPPPGFREGPPRTFQPMLADSPPQTDLTMLSYHEETSES